MLAPVEVDQSGRVALPTPLPSCARLCMRSKALRVRNQRCSARPVPARVMPRNALVSALHVSPFWGRSGNTCLF